MSSNPERFQGRDTQGKCSQRGFTLLEIMLAVAIIGGLLVTVIYSLNYHLGIAERHEFITVGTLLARGKLTEAEKNPAAAKGNFPEPYSAYSFETTLKDSSYPGVSEISVSVTRGNESVKISDLIEKSK